MIESECSSPFVCFERVLAGVCDPAAAAADWERLFSAEIVRREGRQIVTVGTGFIEFVQVPAGRTGIVQVGVEVKDVNRLLTQMRRSRVPIRGGRDESWVVQLSGTEIELVSRREGPPPTARSPFTRFHHVVIAVEQAERSLKRWHEVFPFEPCPEGPNGVLAAHHVPVGDAWFGITASGTNSEAVSKWVDRRGEGVYAISLVVDDRASVGDHISRSGGRLVAETASNQLFVHPRSTHGILIELAEEWPGNVRRPRRFGPSVKLPGITL